MQTTAHHGVVVRIYPVLVFISFGYSPRERFIWAHCAYASRTFPAYLSRPPAEATPASSSAVHNKSLHACFVPWLDMLNHKYGTPITWRRGPSHLEFVLESDVAEGDEIFNNYGPKASCSQLVFVFIATVDLRMSQYAE